jgi:hypothetical protein
MRTTAALALLVLLPGVAQAGIAASDPGRLPIVMAADSAHTLFQPSPGVGGRAGRIFDLPQGGVGVTTGGTSYYQTFSTPGGGGVAVPDGNYSTVIGSGGHAGTAMTPD